MSAGLFGKLRDLLCSLLSGCSILHLLGVCVLTLVVVLVARLARLIWKRRELSCFACPPQRNWLLGHMGLIRTDEAGMQEVDELVREYRHSCAWFLGPFYNIVRLFHPDYIKPLFLASASITFKDEVFYGLMRPWLGQGLVLSNGRQWSRQRRLLTPAFHFDILKNYVHIFNQSVNIMHEKWRRLLAEGKDEMDMFEHVTLMTLDSLLKCTFSYDSQCQEKSSEYITSIFELSDLVVERQRFVPYHWDWVYKRTAEGQRFYTACKIVHDFTAAIVQERRSQLLKNGPPENSTENSTARGKKKTVDFIDVLLLSKDENGEGLSNEEIKAQADTFMFAGHDTTASALSWVFYNLATHQEDQERCRSEINDLLNGRETEEVTWEDLSNLPFTTMCIKESLRLHPPVTTVTRYYSQDMSVPGGCTIPQGNICLISIYGTHHNPEIWPNPEVFDPMRFDPENSKQRSSYAFVPFSAGPRNCIGQSFALAELRVVLALTLRRFRILPGSRRPKRLYKLIMRTEDGLPLKLEPLTVFQ
ncbi:cytochrome P450 4F3 [Astyanax mexicanus]|uniref:cytochrome P450 4F3 n=1 Tax=Astyanax mexicanus TaxID=7994 RepID=UPI0020CABA24|nr:cytochrome P450 4F3 [Astyanax mexicanus]XP_049320522.1 cytochrome P450 4F3 [Astyanax mexicanus]